MQFRAATPLRPHAVGPTTTSVPPAAALAQPLTGQGTRDRKRRAVLGVAGGARDARHLHPPYGVSQCPHAAPAFVRAGIPSRPVFVAPASAGPTLSVRRGTTANARTQVPVAMTADGNASVPDFSKNFPVADAVALRLRKWTTSPRTRETGPSSGTDATGSPCANLVTPAQSNAKSAAPQRGE